VGGSEGSGVGKGEGAEVGMGVDTHWPLISVTRYLFFLGGWSVGVTLHREARILKREHKKQPPHPPKASLYPLPLPPSPAVKFQRKNR